MFRVIQENVLVLRKYIAKYLGVKEYNVSNIKKIVCVICVYYMDSGSGRGEGRMKRSIKRKNDKADTAKCKQLLNLG